MWQDKCQPYAADYVGLAILIPLYTCLQIFAFDEPFHRMFALDDRRIQYPHADQEHVPVAWLLIYAALFPAILMTVWSLTMFKPHKTHVTLLGFGSSMLLTLFLTDVVKNAVGRPRPDLISRCKPEPGTPEHQLISYTSCTQTNHHLLHDGWRSFPSGHSSFSFSGFGYLSFFLISQFRVLQPRAGLLRTLIAFSPFIGALLIALSRLEDYRHDVFDVVVGSLLGLSVSYFSWRRYYPALSSPQCKDPYPAHVEETGLGKFGRLRDEEEMVGNAHEFELEDDEGRYLYSGQRGGS
ncbi:hypothetical protein MBLNU459_g8511t1 [Dothideomycetes sp. NU459]